MIVCSSSLIYEEDFVVAKFFDDNLAKNNLATTKSSS
jgi:hypothetical protein